MSDDFRTPFGDSTPGPPDATLRALDVGQLIAGRFRLVRPLGKGGMGVVWLAKDESLGDEVAFKFLAEIIAHDEASLHDLKRELRRTRQLTHHHIIRVHDLVEDPARGVAGITMEVAAGGSLAARRAKTEHGWFEPEEIREWTRQLCEALDYAHRTARVVHRDLKPANLLLDAQGNLKIADFGIAAALHESATRLTAGKVSGTPLYMSPEQWQGFPPAPSDDLYALGATLYDLLTGKPPFYSGNVAAAAMSLAPTPMAERRRELEGIEAPVPEEWERAVAALLAKTAAERPTRAGEVVNLLSPIGDAGRRQARTDSAEETETVRAADPVPPPRDNPTPPPPTPSHDTAPPPPAPSPVLVPTGDWRMLVAAPPWPWLPLLQRHRWLGVVLWILLSVSTGWKLIDDKLLSASASAPAYSPSPGLLGTAYAQEAAPAPAPPAAASASPAPAADTRYLAIMQRDGFLAGCLWIALITAWFQPLLMGMNAPRALLWLAGLAAFEMTICGNELSNQQSALLRLLAIGLHAGALWNVRQRWWLALAGSVVGNGFVAICYGPWQLTLNHPALALGTVNYACVAVPMGLAWFYGTRPHRPKSPPMAQAA